MLPGSGGAQLCVTPGAPLAEGSASLSLEMQPCTHNTAADSPQVWKLANWSIHPQAVVNVKSGLCLDIAGVTAKAAAGLPIVAAPCVSTLQDMTHAQRWQFGYSGALITRGASMAVTISDRSVSASLGGWVPKWSSSYPAVRDLKAAIRFVRANAHKYGVDPTRIVTSGGSAGATNSVASGITFDEDYNTELTVEQDPTLATTHQDQNSSVQCVVAHWSTDLEAILPQLRDPHNRSRFTKTNAPIVEFHGSIDGTINISHARDAQARYAQNGVVSYIVLCLCRVSSIM